MPSEKILAQKKEMVAELTAKLKSSCAGVLVDYKGINVADDTALRRRLREAEVEYTVIKNKLLLRALEGAGLDGLEDVLVGTTSLAISENDYVAAAKILCEFAENNKFFNIKGGFIDGGAIDATKVNSLAKLPSREVLVAQVLAGFNGPIRGFVTVLNATLKGLVVALNAIAEKKSA
jgi:large subunit ribosomal protein L10